MYDMKETCIYIYIYIYIYMHAFGGLGSSRGSFWVSFVSPRAPGKGPRRYFGRKIFHDRFGSGSWGGVLGVQKVILGKQSSKKHMTHSSSLFAILGAMYQRILQFFVMSSLRESADPRRELDRVSLQNY